MPLGLLFKNENTNDDMIDILTEIHENYLPVVKTTDDSGYVEVEVLQKIFFGGDQLTEESAHENARQGRADGDTEFERLEGFIPKVEDWHAGRVLYQVCLFDCLFPLAFFFSCTKLIYVMTMPVTFLVNF